MSANDFNQQVIAEFRANGGKVAAFGDAPMVILHTIGAQSGELREVPLVALDQEGDLFVFASKAGSTSNPDWYYNLKANPAIEVEYGVDVIHVTATEVDEITGQEMLKRQAVLMPAFGDYVEQAKPRVIPVFQLVR